MQISAHYSPFTEKTAIVVTNNERARIFSALAREVEEHDELSVTDLSAMENEDDTRGPLYTALMTRLHDLHEKEDFTRFMICVPEINKSLFEQHLTPEIKSLTKDLIPKNLASMDTANIMRILLEG